MDFNKILKRIVESTSEWKIIKNVQAKDAGAKVKEVFPDAKVRRGNDETNEYTVDGKVVAYFNVLDNTLRIKG